MEPVTAPPRPRRESASFARRVLAFLVDGVILTILGFALLVLTSLLVGPTLQIELSGSSAPPQVEVIAWRVMLNGLLLAGLNVGYFVVSWTRALRSPGQALLRINVEDVQAQGPVPLSTRSALLRCVLLGAPLGVAASAAISSPLAFLVLTAVSVVWFALLVSTTLFSRSGRGIHDRIAGSIVARRS
jgi:uncharacterized RDD family membrane protein YckC